MVKQAELLDGFDPIERKRMLAALLEVRTLRALANEQAPLAAVGAAVKQVSESLSGGGLNDADDADDRDIESLDPGQLAARIDAQIKASRGGPA